MYMQRRFIERIWGCGFGISQDQVAGETTTGFV